MFPHLMILLIVIFISQRKLYMFECVPFLNLAFLMILEFELILKFIGGGMRGQIYFIGCVFFVFGVMLIVILMGCVFFTFN